jgi:hypothetical protein
MQQHNNGLNEIYSPKDKHLVELEKVKKALFSKPQTMKELDISIGVMRESICWYCRTLRQLNQLFKVKQRRCNITGYPYVWELTTDPSKAPKQDCSQLNLFEQ